MSKNTEVSTKAIVSGLKNLSASAKALHAKKDELKGQIAALHDAPVSLEDFAVYLRKWISVRAANYSAGIQAVELVNPAREFGDGFQPMNTKSWRELEMLSNANARVFSLFKSSSVLFNQRDTPAIDAFCYFLPEIVEAKLMDQITKSCAARWGNHSVPPIAQRIEAIEEYQKQLEAMKPEIEQLDAEIANASSALSGSDD